MAAKDTIIYPVILNNLSQTSQPNVFRYLFPSGSVNFKKAKIAVAQISLYYSWYNITSTYNNNSFQFIFPNALGTTTYTVSIPNGYYDIASLNSYLQQFCITNSLYLVNSSGQYVYYLEFQTNENYYAIQFNAFPVPTSLPAGWSNPAGLSFPLTAYTPQLVVSSNDFTKLIGFNSGTYPTVQQTTSYSKLSTFTPQVSPVQSVILACSLLNNRYSNPGTILYSFSPSGVSFGSTISSSPYEFSFIPIQDGGYPYFDIILYDQNYAPLQLNDNNLIIQLLIKNAEDDF